MQRVSVTYQSESCQAEMIQCDQEESAQTKYSKAYFTNTRLQKGIRSREIETFCNSQKRINGHVTTLAEIGNQGLQAISEKVSLFISYDFNDGSSKEAIHHIERKIQETLKKGEHANCRIVFEQKAEGSSEWQALMQTGIQKSDMVILYVTKKYLKSDFCLSRIFEAMKVLGTDWGNKIRILCDLEMQELLNTREKWIQYLNECANFWKKEYDAIEKEIKNSTVGVQMALASEREYLYYNRVNIPAFIQGIRERKHFTLNEIIADVNKLIELKKRITSSKKTLSEYQGQAIVEFEKPIPTFTGRVNFLKKIETELRENNVVVISGLSGVGKTQLAIKYIEEHRSNYSLIWTFNAQSETTLDKDYNRLAERVGLDMQSGSAKQPSSKLEQWTKNVLIVEEKNERIKICEKVNTWLMESVHERWLFYFDNVTDPLLLNERMPKSEGEFLITTQSRSGWETIKAWMLTPQQRLSTITFAVVPLLQFEENESIELLEKLISKHNDNKTSLFNLAEAMGHLPLALNQAGRFIEKNDGGLTIESYLRAFYKDPLATLEKQINETAIDHDLRTVGKSLRVTLWHIKNKFSSSAKLLYLCAYFYHAAIPSNFLNQWIITQEEIMEDPLCEVAHTYFKPLVDFSLLSREDALKNRQIHPLLQLVIRETLSPERQKYFIKEALKLIHKIFSCYDPENRTSWKQAQVNLLHAIHVLNHAREKKLPLEERAELCRTVGRYYFYTEGKFREAKSYFEEALMIYQNISGKTHRKSFNVLCDLAHCSRKLGNAKDTVFWHKKISKCFHRSKNEKECLGQNLDKQCFRNPL